MSALIVISGGGVAAAAAVAAANAGSGTTLEGWIQSLLLGIIVAAGIAMIVWILRSRE